MTDSQISSALLVLVVVLCVLLVGAVFLVLRMIAMGFWFAFSMSWLSARKATDEELNDKVFNSLREYANVLGNDHPVVAEYLNIVDRGDWESLEREWPRLEKGMAKRSRELGHRGRPLILDYHWYYDTVLKELVRRRRRARGQIAFY